jgi:ADP-ribosyl-[dinitrogen reductase] hydrolase
MKLSPAVLDRAVGAVAASAVGDALGAPYEFGPPRPDARCAMEGGGSFQWRPGEWTDDTQLALAVLSPMSEGHVEPKRMGRAMIEWFASTPRDVGVQTASVLRRARHGLPMKDAAAAYQAENPDAAGNGALMRTAPVALGHLGDRAAIAELAREVAALTHPHADSIEACVLWSLAIERAIATASPTEPFDWRCALEDGLDLVRADRRDEWRSRIDAAIGHHPSEWYRSNGWVVAAFQAAVAAITSTPVPSSATPCDHLADTLRLVARSGGDTDTVGAIAGALLGARWGGTAVPLAWRRVLHGRRTYAEPPVSGAQLDAMARLAIRGGNTDSIGWPGEERLIERYIEDWDAEPRRVELEGAWFGTVADVEGAVADGATVVVSLCRMGTDDVAPPATQLTVGLIDSNPADNPNLVYVLQDTARAVADLVDAGERVFVHCVAAQNRAPSLAAAYLRTRGAPADEAIDRASEALRSRPKPFLRDAIHQVEPRT